MPKSFNLGGIVSTNGSMESNKVNKPDNGGPNKNQYPVSLYNLEINSNKDDTVSIVEQKQAIEKIVNSDLDIQKAIK